jgi:hypothetical protein
VPSMPMPAALWPNTLLHRHSVFCETDQEAVNKAKLYVDGHGLELWEGTRQVALLTRSNLPLNSGGFFAAASAAVRPSAWERSTVGGVISMCQVPPGTSV